MNLKSFAWRTGKALAEGALYYTGIRQVVARAARAAAGGRRVLIVSYHRVVEDFDREAREAIPGLLIGRETFRRHLEELGRGGFDFVSLGTALDVVAGRKLPRRDVAVVTFDDGYRDVWEHAFPVMKRMGVPGTVYLATGLVGTDQRFPHDRLYGLLKAALAGRDTGRNELAWESAAARAAVIVDELIAQSPAAALTRLIGELETALGGAGELARPSGAVLDWAMVREMAAAGIDFGSHTVDHVVLTHESDAEIERQIAASKRAIELNLERPVVDFAYPNGYYDRRVVQALVRHGFRSAVTTEDLPNRAGSDPFRLKRKTLWENFSRGPFGYSGPLTACHLDDVFAALNLTRPILGERLCRDAAAEETRTPKPGANVVAEGPAGGPPAKAEREADASPVGGGAPGALR